MSANRCPFCDGQGSLVLSGRPARGRIKARLRMLIETSGARGLTVDELEQETGVGHQSVSARVWEMTKNGEVESAGERKTRSGHNAIAYRMKKPLEVAAAPTP